jgi:hypothetical protein
LTPWLVVVTAGSSCRRFGLATAAAAAVLEVSFSKSTLPFELLSLSQLSLYRHSSSMLVGAAHNNDSREDRQGPCVRASTPFLYKIGQAAARHTVSSFMVLVVVREFCSNSSPVLPA